MMMMMIYYTFLAYVFIRIDNIYMMFETKLYFTGVEEVGHCRR